MADSKWIVSFKMFDGSHEDVELRAIDESHAHLFACEEMIGRKRLYRHITRACRIKSDLESSGGKAALEFVMTETESGLWRFPGLHWVKFGKEDRRLRSMRTIYDLAYHSGIRAAIRVRRDGSRERIAFENHGWRII